MIYADKKLRYQQCEIPALENNMQEEDCINFCSLPRCVGERTLLLNLLYFRVLLRAKGRRGREESLALGPYVRADLQTSDFPGR